MLARLSATSYPQLGPLTTREADDPAIALLDCWAIVADVLTFYQERIANEGYLTTAAEPESLARLGQLVGYRPRPALAASAFLAYTLDPGAVTTIPAGSQAKSVPPPGGLPQTFETSQDGDARQEWNTLAVRQTRPAVIQPDSDSGSDQLELAGIVPNLKAGDRMLFLFGTGVAPATQTVHGSRVDPARGRTVVSFTSPSPDAAYLDSISRLRSAIAAATASAREHGSTRGSVVSSYITPMVAELDGADTRPGEVLQPLAGHLRALSERRAIARVHVAAEIVTWPEADEVADAGDAVLAAAADAARQSPIEIQQLATLAHDLICPPAPEGEAPSSGNDAGNCDSAAALVGLMPVLPALRKPPSTPPVSPRELQRTVADLYAPDSDLQLRLLSAADPRLGTGLHRAWASETLAAPPAVASLQVMRIKARLFDPQPSPLTVGAAAPADAPGTSQLVLDAVYDGIVLDTWVIVDGIDTQALVRRVSKVGQTTGTITQDGQPPVSVTVTIITLDGSVPVPGSARTVTVWARGEAVQLADEPVTADLEGQEIELDRVYDGLQPGRLLVVSGERTDIPYTAGIQASELVMLGGVRQAITQSAGDSVHTTLLLARGLAYSYKRDSVAIYGNVVPASQGETRTEVLGSGNAAAAGQSFPLRQVTQQNPLTFLPADTPSGAQDTLTVRVNGVSWTETESLVWAAPADHSYVTLTGTDGQPSVVFGDGVHGARPATGTENLTASYRIGAGSSGNVAAGAISQLVSRPLGVNAVVNPQPATGGTDADGPADARATTPLRVLALDRLTSVRDYEDFTRARAGIGKASARRLFDGQREVVHVTIAAAGDAPVDPASGLFTALEAALADFGDPNLPVRVAVRELLLIVMSAGVHVLPDYTWDLIEPAVRSAALGTLGFARRELGQPAYQSEVVAAMQSVEGVDYIDVDVFGYLPGDVDPVQLATIAARLGLASRCVPARPARFVTRQYQVTTQDTLTSVANAHGLSLDELLRLNPGIGTGGTEPGHEVDLTSGQELVVQRGIRPAQLALLSPAVPETLILRRIP
jgi:predicted phage baseplate assembly protein